MRLPRLLSNEQGRGAFAFPLCCQLAKGMCCFYAAGYADWLFDEADLWLVSLLFFLFLPFWYLLSSFLIKQAPFLNFQWGHYGLTHNGHCRPWLPALRSVSESSNYRGTDLCRNKKTEARLQLVVQVLTVFFQVWLKLCLKICRPLLLHKQKWKHIFSLHSSLRESHCDSEG